MKIFNRKYFDIFLIFAQNYTLEPPRPVPTIYVLEQKGVQGGILFMNIFS